ncbi:256_t:CDS:2 [Cetraspora pellucida]|uniref:256_t:CDS:1 n=1 Tax=Cetraspora pellucida TaxID=1433469 RepID=A0A9N9A8R1_9GLOM|nr:256_t:CDS:2 [Cetraspora pellucida]
MIVNYTEITKLVIFSKLEDEDIRMDSTIEDIYLALTAITLLKDITFTCAICRGSYSLYKQRERARVCFIFILAWTVIPATYTVFLFQDLDSIPLICPRIYHYKSQILNQACMIRMLDFLLMWSYTALFYLTVLLEIIRYLFNHNSDDDLEDGQNEPKRSYRTLFSISDMSTHSENNVSSDKNVTPNNGHHSHHSSCSTTSNSPLSRPKPTYKNSLFSPPSHEQN